MDGTPVFIKPAGGNASFNKGTSTTALQPSSKKDSGFAHLFSVIQGKADRVRQGEVSFGGKQEPGSGKEFPEKDKWKSPKAEQAHSIAPAEKLGQRQEQFKVNESAKADEPDFIEPGRKIERNVQAETVKAEEPDSTPVTANNDSIEDNEELSPFTEVPASASIEKTDPQEAKPVASSELTEILPLAGLSDVNVAPLEVDDTVSTNPAIPVAAVATTTATPAAEISEWDAAKPIQNIAPAGKISTSATVNSAQVSQVSIASLEARAAAAAQVTEEADAEATPVALTQNQATRTDTVATAANYTPAATQTQINKERQQAVQIQKAEEAALKRPALSEKYAAADAVTRRRIFEAEWARAQVLSPSASTARSGTEIQMLNPTTAPATSSVPADGLPPFLSAVTRSAPAAIAAASGMNSAGAPGTATLNLRQQGWENSLSKNVNFMIRENMNSLQVKVNPAELGPINLHLSMDQDKLSVQINANQATTRELLEQAAPRLRDMLAEHNGSSVDVNVADHGGDEQQHADEGTDQIFIGENDQLDGAEGTARQAQINLPGIGLVDTFA